MKKITVKRTAVIRRNNTNGAEFIDTQTIGFDIPHSEELAEEWESEYKAVARNNPRVRVVQVEIREI